MIATMARSLVCLGCAIAVLAVSAGAAGAAGPVAQASRVRGSPAGQSLQLMLPLKVDGAGLSRFARSVSTPGSPQYAQYQSISTLARRFGPSATAKRTVVAYLRRAGATSVKVDATGLFVEATMGAGIAQRVFATELAQYRDARAARFVAPASSVEIPPALAGLITGVVGLDTRPLTAPPAHGAADRSRPAAAHIAAQTSSAYFPASGTRGGCAAAQTVGGFTPNQYLTAYRYDPLHSAAVTGQGERVALIEIDGFKNSDVQNFARCFGLRVPPINSFTIGVKKPLSPGGESTLDLELLDAAAPGLKAIDVYESGAAAASTLKAITAPLQNRGFKPQVISASLGLCEPFTFEALGRSGIQATELALAEAAASGITILASSGDDGSADCTDGSTPVDKLAVNYPASSWWVTGVGGTNVVLNAANAIQSQVVWNDTNTVAGSAGGGGTSMLFNRPRYQDGSVTGNSRAVPDVSMLSDVAPGYAVYCSASAECTGAGNSNPWQTVGGTSAATPLLAGGFALVDQRLRMRGRQDLGLVNPLLYKLGRTPALSAQVFSDVTQGSNDVGPFILGSGEPLGCCTAALGYDDASGWGSIDLAGFAAAALTLQPRIVNVSLSLPGGQNPIDNHQITAKISCSGPCLVEAFATVMIGHSRLGRLYSNVYHLRSRGQKWVSIKLAASDLTKLRAALAGHRPITADLVGAVVDAGGNIEKQTASKRLTITG